MSNADEKVSVARIRILWRRILDAYTSRYDSSVDAKASFLLIVFFVSLAWAIGIGAILWG